MKIFDLMMMITLIITDLIVVFACWFSYRKNFRYTDGMMLGVHIPLQHAEDPDITEFCRKKAKDWELFNKINVAAGCLVCIPALFDWGLCIILWTVWLMVYLVLMYFFIFKPHRELYRIKKERGWFDETTKHKVIIDTKLSASTGRMAPSWKWHIPVAVVLVLTGGIAYTKTDGFGTGGIELMMLIVSLFMCVMFAGFHICIAGRRNKVYSENTELNFEANKLHKSAWAWACLWSSIFTSAAGIYVIYDSVNGGFSDRAMMIYVVLVTVSVFIMVYNIIRGERKIRNMLDGDSSAVYIDDDEYWKWGIYNNPSDRRIMVQSKWSSTKYTVNVGHPVGKVIMWATVLLLVGTLVFTLWTFVALGNTETFFTVEDNTVTFDAFMYKYTVDPAEIENIALIDEMPDEHFSRSNGASTGKVNIGNYQGSETGRCKMFIHNGESPILMIETDNMTVFANSTEEGVVEDWYETITDMM